jgi:hypothetical protein
MMIRSPCVGTQDRSLDTPALRASYSGRTGFLLSAMRSNQAALGLLTAFA